MLNLKRGMRAFSVALVAVMLFAAVFAAVGFSDTAKSNGETVLGATGFGSVNLSADSVDVTVDVVNEGIFESLNVVQRDIASLLVTGKVDVAAYEAVVDGDIAIRIGNDILVAQVMQIVVGEDGTFSLVITLNSAFCNEFGNKIPVIVSYTEMVAGTPVETEIKSVMGVITYDYESGVIGYPAGTEYVNKDGGLTVLTTPYIPVDDIKMDEDDNVTVMYQSTILTFKANTAPVQDAPEGYVGEIVDVEDDTVVLKVVAGLEYGYAKSTGSITNEYGSNIEWVVATSDELVITELEAGTTYVFWARKPAANGVLAGPAVVLAKSATISEADAAAKDAFLNKYAEVVVNGDELYTTDDPAVTANNVDTLQLLALYNVLSDDVKALEVISEKAEYLVLSNFLAKWQSFADAAKDADSYADLRTDYTYNDILASVEEFSDVMDDLWDRYSDNEDDRAYIVELSLAIQKAYATSGVDANDAAKDEKFAAVDFIYDLLLNTDFGEYEEEYLYKGYASFDLLAYVCEEYDLFNFINEYQDYLYVDGLNSLEDVGNIEIPESVSTETVENILADFIERNFVDYDMATDIYELINNELVDRYLAVIDELIAKYDEEDFIVYILEEYAYSVEDAEFPYNKQAYTVAVIYEDTYAKITNVYTALEALKDGKGDDIADIIDAYIEEFGYAVEDFGDLGYAVDPAVLGAKIVADANEILAKANAHLAFIAKKLAAKAEIDALKDANQAVINVANKYLPEIDVYNFDYNNVETLNAGIDALVAAAKAEVEFEKARPVAKAAISESLAALKTSGKYSADQLAQLDAFLAKAYKSIDNLDFAAGAKVADMDAVKATADADFATVKVSSVSAGNVPYVGDASGVEYTADVNTATQLWGNVTNYNGMDSALTLSIKVVAGKEKLTGSKVIVAAGSVTDEEAVNAVSDKKVLLTLDITLANGTQAVTGSDNGIYTVKVLLPAELRDATGLYVVSENGDATYVYETTREGNYIVFKTTHFSEYLIVGDKDVNLTWLVVILAILLVAEIAVIVFFIIKKKGVKAASFVPFLAILYTPSATVPAAIILSGLATFGAVIAIFTVVRETKKKTN